MRTNFRDNLDGSHQLKPVLDKIDEAIAKSDANPCYTPGCQCDVLEDVLGKDLSEPSLAVCDGCRIHWLLETAAVIARDVIAKSRLS